MKLHEWRTSGASDKFKALLDMQVRVPRRKRVRPHVCMVSSDFFYGILREYTTGLIQFLHGGCLNMYCS